MAVQRPHPRTILRPLRYSVQIAAPVAAGCGTGGTARKSARSYSDQCFGCTDEFRLSSDSVQQHSVVNDPVTLHLPGGIRMYCHPSQLADVFRALRYAES